MAMSEAHWVKVCTIIGKFCNIYDIAAADEVAMKVAITNTYDQISVEDNAIGDSYENLVTLSPHMTNLNNAMNQGAEALQTRAVALTSAYLTSSTVKAYFDVTGVSAAATGVAMVDILIDQMTQDSETFDLDTTTGFANFFANEWATDGTTPTNDPGTRIDTDYVKSTVIADP